LILKENFPHNIELVQENLDLCLHSNSKYKLTSKNIELRRLISVINYKNEESNKLYEDEIEDCWYVLQICLEINNSDYLEKCIDLLLNPFKVTSLNIVNTN